MSKFIQAMKNPNWRKRGDREYKSDPHSSMPAHHRAASSEYHQRLAMHSEDANHRMSLDEIDAEPWEILPYDDYHDEEERASLLNTRHTYSADNGTIAASSGLCSVTMNQALKNKDVPGALNLIQLIPFFNSQSPAHEASASGEPFDVVQIQRLTRKYEKKPQHERTDDLNAQLSAALETATKTPPRMKPSLDATSISGSKSRIPTLSKQHPQAKVQDLLYTDRDHQRNYVAHRAPRLSVGHESQRHSTDSDAPKESLTDQNTNLAFEKMLQKLHRRADRGDTRDSYASLVGAMRSVHISDSTSPISDERGREDRRDARNTESSDSGYGSGPWTNHTGSATAASSLSSFNPRAREFLSFSGKEAPVAEEYQHQKFRRLPIADLFKQSGQEPQPPDVAADATAPAPDQYIPSSYTPLQPEEPMPDLSHEAWKAALYNLLQAGNNSPSLCPAPEVAPNLYATWSPGQVPHSLMPLAMPTFSPIPASGSSFPSAAPAYVSGGLSPPSICPPMLPFPVPTPQLSAAPISTQFGTNTANQPRYVPKPRKPDPTDQLAYEAWIEWRKAHEPGYALECKMRQKRRAQRTGTSKSKCQTDEKTNTTSSEALSLIT